MPRLQLLGHSPDVLYLGDDIVNRIFYGDIQIFPRGYSMGAVVGSYSFNGQPAIMSKSRILSMGVGAYTLTGQAASLSRSLKVIAALGTYALSGQNATLSKTRRLISDVGAYTLTGQDVNLKRSVLVAAVGAYTMAGLPVGLVYARRMAANLGTYVLTGQDTQAYKTILMPAAVGSYTLSGQAVNLIPTRKVIAAVGNYTLTGQIANLIRSLRLVADAASYILTGQSSILAYNRVLKADVGSYVFTGLDALLTKSGDPYFGNVSLLHLYQGADASTVFTDSSLQQQSWGVADNAQIDTAQFYQGVSSALFDGSGDYIYQNINGPGGSWHDLGAGDFTIEAFVRFSSVAATQQTLIDFRGSSATNNPCLTTVGGKMCYVAAAAIRITGSTTLAVNTWYHVAVSRNSGVSRLYVNGVQEGSSYTDPNVFIEPVPTYRPIIGSTYAIGFLLYGWLGGLRVTKGVGLYPSGTTFTAPTSFPTTGTYAKNVTFIASSESTGNTIAVPDVGAGAAAGDIAILFDFASGGAFSIPTDVTATGWNLINMATLIAVSNSLRTKVYWKALTGGDLGATVTGLNGSSNNNKLIMVFRSDNPNGIVTPIWQTPQATASAPSNQSAGTTRTEACKIVIGAVFGTVGPAAFQNLTTAFDAEITVTNSRLKAGYSILNDTVAPGTRTIGATDTGNNALHSGYLFIT